MLYRTTLTFVACLSLTALSCGAEQCDGLPLIFADNFEQGAGHWQPTDSEAWKITEIDGQGKVYDQHRQSAYKPPYRSPSNLSLLKIGRAHV